MFKRVLLEDWHVLIPLISFGTLFAIFVLVIYRTLRMKKDRIDHFANMPLEEETNESSNTNPDKSEKRHE